MVVVVLMCILTGVVHKKYTVLLAFFFSLFSLSLLRRRTLLLPFRAEEANGDAGSWASVRVCVLVLWETAASPGIGKVWDS